MNTIVSDILNKKNKEYVYIKPIYIKYETIKNDDGTMIINEYRSNKPKKGYRKFGAFFLENMERGERNE